MAGQPLFVRRRSRTAALPAFGKLPAQRVWLRPDFHACYLAWLLATNPPVAMAAASGAVTGQGLPVAQAPNPSRSMAASRAYAINGGPLGNVLAQFAGQSGVPLSFDPTQLTGIQSPGLRGTYTVQEGFDRLLSGSGYVLVRQGGDAYSLRRLPAQALATTELPTVTVSASLERRASELPEAYAGGQVARGGRLGMLGNSDVMDAPFNVAAYTSEWLTNRQSVTLADALNGDPSVRFTGQIGGVTDSFYIRGFPIGEGNAGEIAFDGVYGVAPNYHVFTDYIERVEVIKGPAALLYGMSPNGGVGGVVNMVPKRALDKDLTRVTADYGSDTQWGGRADISRRLGDEKEWGIRLNGMHRQGGTALDNQRSRTDLGALSLDYQGARFRASLDVISQYEKVNAPTRPMLLAPGVAVPNAPDGRRNVTQSWGWWKSDSQSALLRAEYDVTDRWTIYGDVGGSDVDISRLSDQTPTILNGAGDVRSTPANYRFNVERATYNAGVRGSFETGPVKHTVNVQGSMYKDRISTANVAGTPVLTNIYDPVSRARQAIAAPAAVPKTSSSDLSGVALSDTLSVLDDRAQLTLGMRHQRIESRNFNAATGARTVSYDESAYTPLAGLVVKPMHNVSLYANYIQGLSKGDVAPSTASNAGQVFAPYKAKQTEVGIKVDLDSAMVSLSAFQIKKPSGQITNGIYAADSEQRNRGLELNLSGEVVRGMRLLGGVTYLNGELKKTSNPATQGNRPVGVPKYMANLGAEWDLPWMPGLTLTGNVIYTGREFVDQANTQSVPSWTTFDIGARYVMAVQGKKVTLRGTVLNVADRGYWSGVASYGTISQGAPRTFLLSASVDF